MIFKNIIPPFSQKKATPYFLALIIKLVSAKQRVALIYAYIIKLS